LLVFVRSLRDLTIRSATRPDVASVLLLWETVGAPPTVSDTPEGLSRLLATDGDALLLAVSNRMLVGTLIAAWDGWRGSFYRLAVHPERRREGIGSELVRAGERRLRERQAMRFTAVVADDDPMALRFWSTAGYQRQQHRTRFVRLADG
jgi:ribosomal protein S18 acetylase RimI-like enzyme